MAIHPVMAGERVDIDAGYIHDEVAGVEITGEVGSRSWPPAGFDRLASAALMAADLLRRRAATARPPAGH